MGTPFWWLQIRCYSPVSWQLILCDRILVSVLDSCGEPLGWFKAVQALQSIGLIGVVVSCIYSIVTNCCQSRPSYTRFLEMFAGGSGVVGFVSVMIYIGKTAKLYSDYYSWAFGLDLAGCIIVIIAALIFACNNNRDSNASTAPPVYYPGEPVQGGNTMPMVVQSYGPGPYQPPGGVAGYPPAYAMPPQYPAGMPPQYPAGMPPQDPAGMPPQYSSAPPQGYGWGAPPPPVGSGAQFQGYSGYDYPHGYSGAPGYPQAPPLESKSPQ
ncbi:uncharacterized protein [Littorina saxatilis]|uniref:uncharacterized protein isoform X2 n=1 Tax=Littorina saxatilis TaxID=31220 RepID=UPI0038B5DB49